MLLRLLCHLAVVASVVVSAADLSKRVVYAVNCGGPEHVGEGGIHYSADVDVPGTVDSDFGARYYFANAHNRDRELYQTERYSLDSFTYSFPAKEGHFTLILKFSEVYFTEPGKKVFDVVMNGIPIVENLDILLESRGVGAAHDRYIEFIVKEGVLQVAGRKKTIGSTFDITLSKGLADNPKINAIAILRGSVNGLPPVPVPFAVEEPRHSGDEMDEDEYLEELPPPRRSESPAPSVASGPKLPNPYEGRNDYRSVVLISLFVLIIPAVFFLRRM